MVYIELNGRIGNNLFQIAAGASYAKKYNLDFCVVCHDGYFLPEPDNCYIKDYIKQFKSNILKDIPIREGRPNEDCYYFYEKDGFYNEIPYHENILLYGVFYSYKYFDEQLVQELFKIRDTEKQYILQKYGDLFDQDITSIHVRRGDYYNQPHKYPIATMKYFTEAIKRIGRNKKYFVISDDIDWCKKNFIGDNFYFSDYEKPIIDLYIQTLCTNNIISNSTFSWWGAYLNRRENKTVICPDPWFGRYFEKNNSTELLIPKNWIQIKNSLPLNLELKASSLMAMEKMKSLVPRSLVQTVKKKLK